MLNVYMKEDEAGRTFYSWDALGSGGWYNLEVMLCRRGLKATQINLIDLTGVK